MTSLFKSFTQKLLINHICNKRCSNYRSNYLASLRQGTDNTSYKREDETKIYTLNKHLVTRNIQDVQRKRD